MAHEVVCRHRVCVGISGKSQILFALVYTTRYLDLVTSYVSLYNTSMKCVFIVTSYTTIYLIYLKFKATYDRNHDTFRIEFLIVPAFALALLIHHEFTPLEILWTFSIYLEAVAILPQLFMVIKTGEAESITSHKPALFTSALGEISTAPPNCNSIPYEKKQLVYACGAPFYPAPCADAQPRPSLTGEAESITSLHYLFALGSYRALYILNWVYRYATEGYYDLIAIVAGVVQTAIYCDFFCWYIAEVWKGKKMQLPA